MIVLYHNGSTVVSAENASEAVGLPIAKALLKVAAAHKDSLLVWCDVRLKNDLNASEIPGLMHHKRLLIAYGASPTRYLGSEIGYCEEGSPFLPVKSGVRYPTWQLSADVGAIFSGTLLSLQPFLNETDSFDYALVSLAKRAMPKGLLCYSEPMLLMPKHDVPSTRQAGTFTLFRFVSQHYRKRWTLLLLLNLMLYRRRFALFPMLFSWFYRGRKIADNPLSHIEMRSSKTLVGTGSIDVIIPTIGRKDCFRDVMVDLSRQTYLPKRVVVVEQNPDKDSKSELDFLKTESWPFEIDHTFTHRAGAVNARNVALEKTTSEFVFLADDDIRFGETFIESAFDYFKATGNPVLQAAGPQPGETVRQKEIVQHPYLGSGWVLLKRSCLDGVRFSDGLEFGYGEDNDFGQQLRNKGFDNLLVPFLKVLHLKAPMGGFRTKPRLDWSEDAIQPKPSPTVMLHLRRNTSKEQVQAYKTNYFAKNWRLFGKNPVSAFGVFRKQWKRSVFWANELSKR